MSSFFSWLDYSESERKKVLDVVQAFGDRETRDELGVGTVRDAYSDLLAPGTSTIQTRARYFLFVPWIHLRIEKRLRSRKSSNKTEIAKLIRKEETSLIKTLTVSDDSAGTIGIDAGENLKTLPSTIYWSGLAAWGIRLFLGSKDQYYHALAACGPPPPVTQKITELEPANHSQNWHQGLPACPKDFPYNSSFTIRQEEAEYLRERILHRAAGTLLAFLVDQGKSSEPVKFPWEHPQAGELPGRIKRPLLHAQNFSETINGAALVYNHMLAKKTGQEERVSEYEKKFSAWTDLINTQAEIYAQWDLKHFWEAAYSVNQRIPSSTKKFIDNWLDLLFSASDPQALLNNSQVENFISDRERFLKRGQARLFNQRALELWGGAAGTARLDYRWKTVSTFLADIQADIPYKGAEVA